MQYEKRPLTIDEAGELRYLIGNAHDDAVRDTKRCQQHLQEALRLLITAGWPLGPTDPKTRRPL